MLNKNLAFTLLLLSTQSFAQQEGQKAEKILFNLSAPESATCQTKTFNSHAFKLTVSQTILEDGKIDTSKTRIYEDGVLRGVCKEEVKINSFSDYSKVFTNLAMIKDLNDDEVLKLFSSNFVGYCSYNYGNLAIYKGKENKVILSRELFKTMLDEKAVELDSNDLRITLPATLRDLVNQKKCGTFTKEIVLKTKESNLEKFAISDVGFDYLVSSKTTKEEFLKARFNAKKLLKEFNISLEEFKTNKYSAAQLTVVGFGSAELYKAKYPLSELLYNQDVSELKSLATIKEFISAGAGITVLKRVGFDEVKDLKPFFTITEFKEAFSVYNDYYAAPRTLKRLGFTAKEIKDVNYGVSVLKEIGFDEIQDIKPLFTIQELKEAYSAYNDYSAAPKALKRLGFTSKEIKNLNYSVSILKEIGFDEIKDIKPLFTIQELKEAYSVYNDYYAAPKALKRLGYSAKEIKDVNFGVTVLKEIGFEEIKDIKPLFTIQELKEAYSVYNDYNAAPKALKRLGYSAKEIKNLNYSISTLKEIGFDEIKDIKPLFTIQELKEGYSIYNDYSAAPKALKRLGFSTEEIKSLGYSAEYLKSIGV